MFHPEDGGSTLLLSLVTINKSTQRTVPGDVSLGSVGRAFLNAILNRDWEILRVADSFETSWAVCMCVHGTDTYVIVNRVSRCWEGDTVGSRGQRGDDPCLGTDSSEKKKLKQQHKNINVLIPYLHCLVF